jgi:hypothetical protein
MDDPELEQFVLGNYFIVFFLYNCFLLILIVCFVCMYVLLYLYFDKQHAYQMIESRNYNGDYINNYNSEQFLLSLTFYQIKFHNAYFENCISCSSVI